MNGNAYICGNIHDFKDLKLVYSLFVKMGHILSQSKKS